MVWKEVDIGMIWNKLKPAHKIVVILLLCTVLLVAYFTKQSVERVGKIAVTITSMPSDATFYINNNTVNSGTIFLKPGSYQVQVKKEGFKDFSSTVLINEERNVIAPILQPDSEDAEKWFKDNESEYYRILALGERAAYESGKSFNERNPIAVNLPYRTFQYTIGYRGDPTDPNDMSIIIEIDAAEPYRQSALYKIRQLGFDPTDFNINFKNYENPFPL